MTLMRCALGLAVLAVVTPFGSALAGPSSDKAKIDRAALATLGGVWTVQDVASCAEQGHTFEFSDTAFHSFSNHRAYQSDIVLTQRREQKIFVGFQASYGLAMFVIRLGEDDRPVRMVATIMVPDDVATFQPLPEMTKVIDLEMLPCPNPVS